MPAHTTRKRKVYVFTYTAHKLMLMSLSAYVFLSFCPWAYKLKVQTCKSKAVKFFNIVIHVFSNLF